jgi:hypothetical protein
MKHHLGFVIVFLTALSMTVSGCISFKAHPEGVVPSARIMTSPYYEVLGEAEGMSSSFRLFWVFPVTTAANNAEAVDDAVKSKGGDNLIEAVFTSESKVYIIGTVDNIYVTGKVIRYQQGNEKYQKSK